MENSLIRTKANMKNKVPEIERTLELVKALKEKQVSVRTKGAHSSFWVSHRHLLLVGASCQ